MSETSDGTDKSKLKIVHMTWPSSEESQQPGAKPTNELQEPSFNVSQGTDSNEPLTLGKDHAVIHSIDLPQSGSLEPSLTVTRLNNGKTVCVVTCTDFRNECSLLVYDLESRAVLSTKEFDEVVSVDGVLNGRVLVRRKDCIEFYCLDTNKVLDTFPYVDLAANAGATLSSEWNHIDQVRAKFDCNPARKQFVIFAKSLSFYQLMEYTTEEGLDKPTVLNCGSTFIYDLSQPPSLERAVLMNGVLFTVPISEVRVDNVECIISSANPTASTVLACDLKSTKSPGTVSIRFLSTHCRIKGFVHKLRDANLNNFRPPPPP